MPAPREDGPSKGRAPAGPGQSAPVVLYEDDFLIAVNKPAGIIVHGDGTGVPTLTDAVRAHLLEEGRALAASELQAVQRLDRDTTGIVLFSLGKEVQPALDRMVAERRMAKTYRAVVEGAVPWTTRTFTGPIGRDRHDARRMRVSRTGKPARTEAEVLERYPARRGRSARTLLLVHLHTGRRHQIRVHLAHAGHPIVGDALYGRPRSGEPLMLHAWRLEFTHPVTGAPVRIEAPVSWAN